MGLNHLGAQNYFLENGINWWKTPASKSGPKPDRERVGVNEEPLKGIVSPYKRLITFIINRVNGAWPTCQRGLDGKKNVCCGESCKVLKEHGAMATFTTPA